MDLLVLQALLHLGGLQAYDLADLLQPERLEHHKLVHAVDKLRPEAGAHLRGHTQCGCTHQGRQGQPPAAEASVS